jgi:hypothetical protein
LRELPVLFHPTSSSATRLARFPARSVAVIAGSFSPAAANEAHGLGLAGAGAAACVAGARTGAAGKLRAKCLRAVEAIAGPWCFVAGYDAFVMSRSDERASIKSG